MSETNEIRNLKNRRVFNKLNNSTNILYTSFLFALLINNLIGLVINGFLGNEIFQLIYIFPILQTIFYKT